MGHGSPEVRVVASNREFKVRLFENYDYDSPVFYVSCPCKELLIHINETLIGIKSQGSTNVFTHTLWKMHLFLGKIEILPKKVLFVSSFALYYVIGFYDIFGFLALGLSFNFIL